MEIFKEKRNAMNSHLNSLIRRSENKSTTKSDSRSMFKILNASLNRKQDLPLPHHTDEMELANEFNLLFDEKINKIRSKLSSDSSDCQDDEEINGYKVENFRTLTETEVKKLISDMPVKHCALDPLPTWLLLDCINEFKPIITQIVNISSHLERCQWI